jgi:hypothetical protein
LIFEIYGLRKNERKVVDDFLSRYSSGSAAATELLDEEIDELPDTAKE